MSALNKKSFLTYLKEGGIYVVLLVLLAIIKRQQGVPGDGDHADFRGDPDRVRHRRGNWPD